jgi:DNA repair exonuclease SbcCD ATPase subunit
VPRLPAELEDAIGRILGDPAETSSLDRSSFDPVEHINAAFPNEQSLVNLDRVLIKLRKKIRKLDDEIRELVRTQTETGAEAIEELKEAKAAIESLHARIKRIKERARQSEEMVQEITKDIKSLDYAKKNLTASVTMLRRLQMLSELAWSPLESFRRSNLSRGNQFRPSASSQ